MFGSELLECLYYLPESGVEVVVDDHFVNVLVVGSLHAGTLLQGPLQVLFLYIYKKIRLILLKGGKRHRILLAYLVKGC